MSRRHDVPGSDRGPDGCRDRGTHPCTRRDSRGSTLGAGGRSEARRSWSRRARTEGHAEPIASSFQEGVVSTGVGDSDRHEQMMRPPRSSSAGASSAPSRGFATTMTSSTTNRHLVARVLPRVWARPSFAHSETAWWMVTGVEAVGRHHAAGLAHAAVCASGSDGSTTGAGVEARSSGVDAPCWNISRWRNGVFSGSDCDAANGGRNYE